MNYAHIQCDIVVPFYSYGTKKQDMECSRHIKEYIRYILRDVNYIPLLNESEECSGTIRSKIILRALVTAPKKKQSSCRKPRQRGGKTRR